MHPASSGPAHQYISTPVYAAPERPKPPAQELIAQTKRYKLAFEVLIVEDGRYQCKIALTNLKPWIIWNWGIALTGGDKIESSPDARIAHLDNGMTYLRPHRPDHNALGYGVDTITFWAKLEPGKNLHHQVLRGCRTRVKLLNPTVTMMAFPTLLRRR